MIIGREARLYTRSRLHTPVCLLPGGVAVGSDPGLKPWAESCRPFGTLFLLGKAPVYNNFTTKNFIHLRGEAKSPLDRRRNDSSAPPIPIRKRYSLYHVPKNEDLDGSNSSTTK
jgi:hypothetical protein